MTGSVKDGNILRAVVVTLDCNFINLDCNFVNLNFTLGLLYLVLKYMTDRYNIYYAYLPSRINCSIHSTVITFFLVALVLLQTNVFFLILLRASISHLHTATHAYLCICLHTLAHIVHI